MSSVDGIQNLDEDRNVIPFPGVLWDEIVPFDTFDQADLMSTSAAKSPDNVPRFVDMNDMTDAEEAGQLAASSFREFLTDPEGSEIFGYIIDGQFTGDRTPDAQMLVDHLIETIVEPDGGDGSMMVFEPPDFSAASRAAQGAEDATSMPDGINAAIIFFDSAQPQALLSNDVGFRDMLLLSQEMFADSVIAFARDLGIAVPEGDVAKQLVDSMRLDDTIAPTPLSPPPDPIEVQFQGQNMIAYPR